MTTLIILWTEAKKLMSAGKQETKLVKPMGVLTKTLYGSWKYVEGMKYQDPLHCQV